MKHNFEERRQKRLEYAEEQARKNEEKAAALHKTAHKMAEHIPMGQPILVGHHSEKAHRNHLKKINNTFSKAVEASDKADYYTQKAKAIERNKAIFSDDPEALQKLDEKIDRLEKLQEFMKQANKCVKKGDKEGFLKLEHASEKIWEELNKPDCFGNLGFASFKLTNNGAKIRNLKKRRDQLAKIEGMETEEQVIKGVRMVKNVEANRVQLIFKGKPSEEVRKRLFRYYRFIWSKSEGAWQRHLNNTGIALAKQFLNEYEEPAEEKKSD